MKRFALMLIVIAACSKSGVSHERAAAACDHQTELGFWKGYDQSMPAGQDAKAWHAAGEPQLVEQKKSDAWKSHIDKCATTFEHATSEQIDCVIAATTADASMACLTSK